MRRLIGVLVLAAVLALGLFPTVLADEPCPRPEIRAFWVDAFHDGAKTPAQIDQLIADALQSNVNTLIVQVRRRGDAYYNLTTEPRVEDSALPEGFDVLADLIAKAHAHGLEVHAWLNTLVGWYNLSTMPKDENHLWWKHGSKIAYDSVDNWVSYIGNFDKNTGEFLNVSPSLYLDPGHPDVIDYTTEIYLNVVRNYDVDGIHLDYSRYNGTNYGYNSISLSRFNARFGKPADHIPAPNDPDWCNWRREQTALLMRKIYLGAIAIKPEIKVSSSVIAWGYGPVQEADWASRRNNTEAFQDWDAWLREGIIDLAMPMNYDREWMVDDAHNNNQKLMYDQWIEWEKNHQYERQTVIGPALYFNYIEQSLEQIREAQQPSSLGKYAAGVSLYSYASTHPYACDDYKDPTATATKALPRQSHQYLPETRTWFYPLLVRDGGYVDPVLNMFIPTSRVFPSPVPIPEMPWKTRPTKGFIMGTVADFAGNTYDGIKVLITGPETREVVTDGFGWFGAGNLRPGHYKVRLSKKDFVGRRMINAWVRPGKITEVNFEQCWQRGKAGWGHVNLEVGPADPETDPYAAGGRHRE